MTGQDESHGLGGLDGSVPAGACHQGRLHGKTGDTGDAASRGGLMSRPMRWPFRPGAGDGGRGHPHNGLPEARPPASEQSPPFARSVVGAMQVPGHEELARFEHAVLPHLAAAYNLARWLTRDEQDAQDVVQEAYVRAWTFFDRFHGEDGRAWLLTIVRHTGYTWLQRHRRQEISTAFDEEQHSGEREDSNPETLLLQQANQQLLREALEALPVEYREVIVLRELEGLSYKEIAGIADLPLGTVMSRLARARQRLLVWLTERRHQEI
jgi:RNA polymerase sigma factor (sigma-70 family)